MAESTFTFRLDDELEAAFAEVAAATYDHRRADRRPSRVSWWPSALPMS